jgi:hypothetical protein
MQRPKPLQFDARPEIKVYVASWAAAALDAWLLKFVIEEVLCRGSQKTTALSANCFFLHQVLGFPVSLLSSSLPQFASDTSALQALARGDAHIFPEVRQSFHL